MKGRENIEPLPIEMKDEEESRDNSGSPLKGTIEAANDQHENGHLEEKSNINTTYDSSENDNEDDKNKNDNNSKKSPILSGILRAISRRSNGNERSLETKPQIEIPQENENNNNKKSVLGKLKNKMTIQKSDFLSPLEREKLHFESLSKMNANTQRKIIENQLKEKREASKRLQKQRHKEQQIANRKKMWMETILPKWPQLVRKKKFQDLLRFGIPPAVRGIVWMTAIDNIDKYQAFNMEDIIQKRKNIIDEDLSDTPTSLSPMEYLSTNMETTPVTIDIENSQEGGNFGNQLAVSGQHQRQRSSDSISSNQSISDDEAFSLSLPSNNKIPNCKEDDEKHSLIEADIRRTFSTLAFFQKGGPMHDALHQLIRDFRYRYPTIGYVQGMSHIASMLLLNMEQEDATAAFCKLMTSPYYHFYDFFSMDAMALRRMIMTCKLLLHHYVRDVSNRFEQEGVDYGVFIYDWFGTLFCKSFPLTIAARIWDHYIILGELFFYRTFVGILRYFKPHLLGRSFNFIMIFLSHLQQHTTVIYQDELTNETKETPHSKTTTNDANVFAFAIEEDQLFDTIFSVKLTPKKLKQFQNKASNLLLKMNS